MGPNKKGNEKKGEDTSRFDEIGLDRVALLRIFVAKLRGDEKDLSKILKEYGVSKKQFNKVREEIRKQLDIDVPDWQ